MMQYHAADRPRGPNGLPLYRTPDGWLAVIPQLNIRPSPDGGYQISVVLLVAPNEAQWFHHTTADLAPLLDDWGADPEAAMMEYFHWKWRRAAGLSLEDLLS